MASYKFLSCLICLAVLASIIILSGMAFLKRLPDLSPEQYQILTARGGDNAGHH
jgi:hypothetical protein